MLVERLDADSQDHRRFLGRLALRDQPGDLLLAVGERIPIGAFARGGLAGPHQGGIERFLARADPLHRVEQRLQGLRLEHVAVRPERHRLGDERLLHAAGEKHDAQILHLPAQLREHLDAAEVGQHQVEHQQVGPQLEAQFNRLPPGPALANHAVTGRLLPGQHRTQQFTDGLMVVNDDDFASYHGHALDS